MERHALRHGQLLVERLAHQRMGEAEATRLGEAEATRLGDAEATRSLGVGEHDARLRGLGQRRERALDTSRLGQERRRELAPYHGGHTQQRVRGLRQRIEAAADRVTYALRKRQRMRFARCEAPALAQPARHLLNEERIALGELAERLRERGLEPLARNRRRELSDLAGGEPAQRHASHVRLAREITEHACERMAAAYLDVAIGSDQQQRRISQLARQEQEEAERIAVRPMQVVDAQEKRRALGRAARLARDALEPAEARLLALGGAERAEDLALGAGAARGQGAQRLEERPERGRALCLPALPGQPAHAAAARFCAELFERSGLADAGLSHDQCDAPAPGSRLIERSPEYAHRLGTSDEGGAARTLEQRGCGRRLARLRLRHEAVAAAVHGLDHAPSRTVVTHRPPRCGYAAR